MNCLHDGVEFTINIMIPKSQDLVAGLHERSVTQAIPLTSIVHPVLSTVNFHNEPAATTFEIHNVRKDRRLATKVKAGCTQCAETNPKFDLLPRHRLAKAPRLLVGH